MQRVDGAYLYELGAQLRPLLSMAEGDTDAIGAYFALSSPRDALATFITNSVFSTSFKTIHASGQALLREIDALLPDPTPSIDWSAAIPGWTMVSIKNKFRSFEAILLAELQISNLYHVSPKGGFDTSCLTDQGEILFPSDLAVKVPDAMADIKAATRCVAFDLPTAAGFHLHRANEATLRIYWDAVTGGKPRPTDNNMGSYLRDLEKEQKGRQEVRGHLKSIKDFHRNPLMHPEQTLESIDQALDLMAAIRCSIGYMLAEIPGSKAPLLNLVDKAG